MRKVKLKLTYSEIESLTVLINNYCIERYYTKNKIESMISAAGIEINYRLQQKLIMRFSKKKTISFPYSHGYALEQILAAFDGIDTYEMANCVQLLLQIQPQFQ